MLRLSEEAPTLIGIAKFVRISTKSSARTISDGLLSQDDIRFGGCM